MKIAAGSVLFEGRSADGDAIDFDVGAGRSAGDTKFFSVPGACDKSKRD